MNKILSLLVLGLSLSALAAPVVLNESSSIKASEINSNFGELKSLLVQKNTPVSFHEFKTGDVIDKQIFEGEFDKVRTLGVEVSPLLSLKVSAQELNLAFAQMLSGIQVYNDIPVTRGVTVTTLEDTIYSGAFDFSNTVGVSTLSLKSQPTKGVLVVSGTNYTYTPDLNKFGPDKFSFQIFDGEHYSNISEIIVNITAVNDAPVSQNFSFTTLEDTAKPFVLTATDVENSPLNFILVSPPENGVLTGTLPSASYVPNLNSYGNDSFSFRVSDGTTESELYTVSFSVTSVNDAPVIASAASLSVNQNSSGSGSVSVLDIDSTTFTYSILAQGTKGTASISSLGLYSYATNSYDFTGVDSFTIVVSDGTSNSNTMTVSVNIAVDSSIIALAPGTSAYYNIFNATGNRTDKVTVFLKIQAGVDIYSVNTGIPALSTGSGWHPESKIEIINNGRILGMGGSGATGGFSSTQNIWFFDGSYYGRSGGDAIQLYFPVKITNPGIIFSGGGGGSSAPSFHGKNIAACGGGGGGGQGYGTSAGGPIGGCIAGYSPQRTAGGNGNFNGPGGGGNAGASGSFYSAGGGAGGAWGSPGGNSGQSSAPGWGTGGPIPGGAAGNSIKTNGYGVTWVSGTDWDHLRGPVVN